MKIAEGQQRPAVVDAEKATRLAFQELHTAEKAHMKIGDQSISIWTNPSMVRSARVIPEGELVLLPTVPLAHIVSKSSKDGSYQKIREDPNQSVSYVDAWEPEDS